MSAYAQSKDALVYTLSLRTGPGLYPVCSLLSPPTPPTIASILLFELNESWYPSVDGRTLLGKAWILFLLLASWDEARPNFGGHPLVIEIEHEE